MVSTLESSQKSPVSRPRKPKSTVREWTEFLFTLVLMVFFIRVTTVEAFRIPTGSMENTLLVGDFLLVNKFVYGIRTPDWVGIPFTDIGFSLPSTRLPAPGKVESGDIVVFKYPLDRSLNYIKRCIAGPGQTIEIRDRQVYVDGTVFENPPHSKFTSPSPLRAGLAERGIFNPRGEPWNHDNFGPLTVPDGHYFVMGDNRDNSADSRYWGFLPENDIVGKALIIYFSWDKNRSLSEFYRSIRYSRIGDWIH
ncbi:signal peptidase I [bacterium]|nr:signal peptidase I [bacterium]